MLAILKEVRAQALRLRPPIRGFCGLACLRAQPAQFIGMPAATV